MARRLEERGQFDEADAHIVKALELDPDSWEVVKEAARICMRDGRTAEAVRHYEKAVELMASDLHAWAMLLTCHRTLGNESAARAAAETSIELAEQVLAKDPSNGAAMSFGARGFAALGKVDSAKEWMERAMLIDFDNLNMRLNFARMLASQMNDVDGALKLLQRNFSAFTRYQLKAAESDPDFAALRDDPRFANMVARTRSRLGIKDEAPLAAALSRPAAT